jgi:ATP-dependent Zn protease
MSAIGVACVSSVPGAFAASSKDSAHYPLESAQIYEEQLAGGEIKVARFNTKKRSLHLTLKNGTKVRVSYPPHQKPKYEAALKAAGVSLSAAQAPSHKKRYIVGGIAIVVLILIVIGVVLVVRRKRADAEY